VAVIFCPRRIAFVVEKAIEPLPVPLVVTDSEPSRVSLLLVSPSLVVGSPDALLCGAPEVLCGVLRLRRLQRHTDEVCAIVESMTGAGEHGADQA